MPIAGKGIESSTRLGRHRWIVESCLSWLLPNRRLVRRYDRKAEHFQAFADLAAALLSYRRLAKSHQVRHALASIFRLVVGRCLILLCSGWAGGGCVGVPALGFAGSSDSLCRVGWAG